MKHCDPTMLQHYIHNQLFYKMTAYIFDCRMSTPGWYIPFSYFLITNKSIVINFPIYVYTHVIHFHMNSTNKHWIFSYTNAPFYIRDTNKNYIFAYALFWIDKLYIMYQNLFNGDRNSAKFYQLRNISDIFLKFLFDSHQEREQWRVDVCASVICN